MGKVETRHRHERDSEDLKKERTLGLLIFRLRGLTLSTVSGLGSEGGLGCTL